MWGTFFLSPSLHKRLLLQHYYHWWAEIILGAIRAYTSLALVPGMESPLMEPSRIILPVIQPSVSINYEINIFFLLIECTRLILARP